MDTRSKLRGMVQDLAYCLRRRDLATTGRWLGETLRTLFYQRIEYTVFARSLEQPLPSFEACLPIVCRLATADDLSYLRDSVLPSEFERLSRRLAHGRICLLALYQDALAAYMWASEEVDLEIDNLELRLEPGDVYLDDAYTLPAYRRQGIQMGLHIRQLRSWQERRCKRTVAIVAIDNLPSQGLFNKLGYQEVDRLSFRRVLFRREYRYHDGRF